MINENSFLQRIKEATGKEIVKDYGFILGTKGPYQASGFHSASNIDGFQIWKYCDDGTETKKLNPSNDEDSFNQIVKFLNRK